MIRTLLLFSRSVFFAFSPLSWSLEQGYLDLKECSDSCETEKSYPHSLQRPLVHLNRNTSLIHALTVCDTSSFSAGHGRTWNGQNTEHGFCQYFFLLKGSIVVIKIMKQKMKVTVLVFAVELQKV